MTKPFAVFDIDGTLIRWQLFHAIVHTLGKNGYILRRTHDRIREARMDWKNRNDSEGFTAYEQVLVTAYLEALTAIHPDDYAAIVDDVYEEFKDQTFTYTRDLVRDLKKQGYLLFAVSGSQHEVVEKIAQHHGFHAAIGAELEVKQGAFTGKIHSPVFDKKAALDTLVARFHASYENSYAVGDSSSDIPLLEAVTHPVVFNPDKKLYDIARTKGWPVVVERKNVVYKID
ncbi:HAD-IB family hydrolase [Candidatus Saccharibacteria bacterium]|nr:MAG: HAD-IB family hydrolase [Candidatus Saccharibacteria bacterium]